MNDAHCIPDESDWTDWSLLLWAGAVHTIGAVPVLVPAALIISVWLLPISMLSALVTTAVLLRLLPRRPSLSRAAVVSLALAAGPATLAIIWYGTGRAVHLPLMPPDLAWLQVPATLLVGAVFWGLQQLSSGDQREHPRNERTSRLSAVKVVALFLAYTLCISAIWSATVEFIIRPRLDILTTS